MRTYNELYRDYMVVEECIRDEDRELPIYGQLVRVRDRLLREMSYLDDWINDPDWDRGDA